MEYNGGSVVAMVGKECVAIASDLRLGNQALGISSNFQKVCAYRSHFFYSTLELFNQDIPRNRSYLPWIARSRNRRDNTVRPRCI
jgi:Proteasome subunit